MVEHNESTTEKQPENGKYFKAAAIIVLVVILAAILPIIFSGSSYPSSEEAHAEAEDIIIHYFGNTVNERLGSNFQYTVEGSTYNMSDVNEVDTGIYRVSGNLFMESQFGYESFDYTVLVDYTHDNYDENGIPYYEWEFTPH
jgi:hypothetical protein